MQRDGYHAHSESLPDDKTGQYCTDPIKHSRALPEDLTLSVQRGYDRRDHPSDCDREVSVSRIVFSTKFPRKPSNCFGKHVDAKRRTTNRPDHGRHAHVQQRLLSVTPVGRLGRQSAAFGMASRKDRLGVESRKVNSHNETKVLGRQQWIGKRLLVTFATTWSKRSLTFNRAGLATSIALMVL